MNQPVLVGLPRRHQDLPDPIQNPQKVRCHAGQAVQRQKRLHDKRAVKHMFTIGDWTMRYYPPAKTCKLDSPWLGPYLVVSLAGWAVGVQLHPDLPILLVHCQDLKKIPRPRGLVSWMPSDQTKPNQTKPNQTKPNQTKPNQTKPNQTKPNQTKSNQTKPNQTEQNRTIDHTTGHRC